MIVPDNILNPFGDELEDIDVLIDGELFDLQGVADILHFGRQTFGGHPFQVEGLHIEPEIMMDSHQGAFGDELQIEGLDQFLEENGGQTLQTQGKPQGFEFFFPVGAVHGRDTGGNMSLVVNILNILRFLGREDLLLQLGEKVEDDGQTLVLFFFLEMTFEGLDFRRIEEVGGLQILNNLDMLGIVFLDKEVDRNG